MGEGQLESIIDKAWEDRESITSATTGDIRDAVEAASERCFDLVGQGAIKILGLVR